MSIRVVDAMRNLRRGRRSSALPFSTIRSVSARRRKAQDCQGIHSPWGERPWASSPLVQFAAGLVTFAQFGIGLLLGMGQFMAAPVAIGQLALALYFWPRPARYRGYGYRPARLRPYGPRPIWRRGARLSMRRATLRRLNSSGPFSPRFCRDRLFSEMS